MNPLLIKPVLDIVGNVFNKIFPDKEQAEKAKQAFMLETANMEADQVKEFHNFIVAYEGAGDKINPFIQILRGSVRPVLTYTLALLYGWGFIHSGQFTPEQMQGLFQLNLISLGFWYGERALKNLGINLGKRK